MMGSLLITLREGLEAFLVVGIILSYLNRSGMSRYNKWIYVGSGLGLVTAFLLAVAFQAFFTGFGSRLGELYIKIVIMGLAVLVLSYMVLWMNKNSQNIKGDVEKKLDAAIGAGSVFSLIFMAYLAILREGFETVLFLGALYGDDMGAPVLYGGLYGLAIALVVTLAIFKGMKNLPLKSFFKFTGGLILLIAAGLLSNVIGVMQDIKLIPIIMEDVVNIGWILDDSSDVGIFFKALFGYTSSPNALQIIAYSGYWITFIYFLSLGNKKGEALCTKDSAIAT